MNRKFLSFLYFALTVAMLVVMLKVANWLPMAIQKDTMRRYSSIEDVKATLNIKDIIVPSYFPQNFAWPPAEIFAQDKPFTAVIMEIKHSLKGDVALIIYQAESTAFRPDEKIGIVQVRERVTYSLKGRQVALVTGVCKNDEPCSRLTWDEGKYRIGITARLLPPELTKIAESMIP